MIKIETDLIFCKQTHNLLCLIYLFRCNKQLFILSIFYIFTRQQFSKINSINRITIPFASYLKYKSFYYIKKRFKHRSF